MHTFYELSGGLQYTEMKTVYVISILSADSKKMGENLEKLPLFFMVTLLGIK